MQVDSDGIVVVEFVIKSTVVIELQHHVATSVSDGILHKLFIYRQFQIVRTLNFSSNLLKVSPVIYFSAFNMLQNMDNMKYKNVTGFYKDMT